MESVEATIRKVAVVDEMVEIETEIESKSYSWLYKDTYIHRTEQDPAVLQEKPTWKSELDVHVQKVLIDPPRRSSAYSIDQSASVHESKAYYLKDESFEDLPSSRMMKDKPAITPVSILNEEENEDFSHKQNTQNKKLLLSKMENTLRSSCWPWHQ